MLKLFTEGKAKFYASTGKISSKLNVFYNPVMKLNRDVSVWLVNKIKPKTVCCPMAASGVRALRFALETHAKKIFANDLSKNAYKIMQRNVRLNKVNIELSNSNLKDLMQNQKFDYIDLDPFGTPVYYLEPCINALNDNGVLAVTATDTSCLYGRYVNACKRKYGSRPLRCGFSKEVGARVLISKVLQTANLKPIFAHSSNHYLRVYFKKTKTRQNNLGYILYCSRCLSFKKLKKLVNENCCGKRMEHAGPLWLGRLWSDSLIKEFNLIPFIQDEAKINEIGFYDMHDIASKYKKELVKIDSLIKKLAAHKFKASRTHFNLVGVKTNANIKKIVSLF